MKPVDDLEARLAGLAGADAAPRPDWQARVWQRLEAAPTRTPRRSRVFALAGIALVVAMGLGLVVARDRSEEHERSLDAATRLQRDLDQALREYARLAGEVETFTRMLAQAHDEAARTTARRALEQARREIAQEERRLDGLKIQAKQRGRDEEPAGAVSMKCDPSDPLCGI